MTAAAIALDAATYQRHALHGESAVWVEKNCYIDVWVEVLHSLGLDPMAMLPFVAAVDFEEDQWTFFKPSLGELWDLYGVDTQELNVWRPLLEHARTHLARGTLVCTEADSFWLPDTQGTDYRRQHVKTSIVLNDLDVEGRRLGYFHNAGYYQLEGEDFLQTFRVGHPPDPAFLPLYAETIRFDRRVARPRSELLVMSRRLLAGHVARRPRDNPVRRFAEVIATRFAAIAAEGLAHYHAWAFANVRQLGAAMELLAAHLRWRGEPDGAAAMAAEAFTQVSDGCKALILKAARAVNGRKTLDATALLDGMAESWQRGMALLEADA